MMIMHNTHVHYLFALHGNVQLGQLFCVAEEGRSKDISTEFSSPFVSHSLFYKPTHVCTHTDS